MPAKELRSLFDLRLGNRAESGYMVRADVLDFYGSIYTHSVPWALVGKSVAKGRVRGKAAKGSKPWPDRLDEALRNVQDGQTNGIDVGPDSSFVISELLLSVVDTELKKRIPGIRGFRYYDDYELYFSERSEAEEGLAALQDALLEMELVLNPRKTEVVALPQPLDFRWAMELRQAARGIGGRRTQRDSLVDLFERSFSLIAGGTREHVLRYAVGLVQEEFLHPDNWPVYEKLLWQASHVEPAILPAVLGEVLRYRDMGLADGGEAPIDLEMAGDVLNRHIMRSLRQATSHEVAWAVWGLAALERSMEKDAAVAACKSVDAVVAVMMLLADERGIIDKGFTTDAWTDAAAPEALATGVWLLAYEAGVRGTKLGSLAAGQGWSASPFEEMFEKMKRAGVTFTADRFGYSEEDFDSDEYDYSFDDDDEDDDEEDVDEDWDDDDDDGGVRF
ncbi:MAG: RNA-directed DNA polymerase [Phycisphaeraceae bacterium]|nr:RNA-directed DNA polymerase [Phycisphaeraceae bacterium]